MRNSVSAIHNDESRAFDVHASAVKATMANNVAQGRMEPAVWLPSQSIEHKRVLENRKKRVLDACF